MLAGDFGMALWMVIPVLRSKVFHANMVAWCPFKESGDKTTVKSDSCGIFVIGPAEGIHYAFGPDQVGLQRPELPQEHSITLKCQKDKDGHPYGERHEPEVPYMRKGPGSSLASYLPDRRTPLRGSPVKQLFVLNSLSPCTIDTDPIVFSDIWPGNELMGQHTWNWAVLPRLIHKPLECKIFDPTDNMVKKGAHVPLWVVLKTNKTGHRSDKAIVRRQDSAKGRGWGYNSVKRKKQVSQLQAKEEQAKGNAENQKWKNDRFNLDDDPNAPALAGNGPGDIWLFNAFCIDAWRCLPWQHLHPYLPLNFYSDWYIDWSPDFNY